MMFYKIKKITEMFFSYMYEPSTSVWSSFFLHQNICYELEENCNKCVSAEIKYLPSHSYFEWIKKYIAK
jgi:hypothetical protein